MTDVLIYLLLIGTAVYAFGAMWVVAEYIIKRINRRMRHENSKRASPTKRCGACKKNQCETLSEKDA